MPITARQFPEVYAALGINIDDLGFVMLDIETHDILPLLEEGMEDDLYYSPTMQHVQGIVVDKKAHVTLLGGLLDKGLRIKGLVDAVLDGWKVPKEIEVTGLGVFNGKEPDGTAYSCIVAHLDPTNLLEANTRLRVLPHVELFPEGYKAHMTLAYVKPEATTEWLEMLGTQFNGGIVQPTELNYGG